MTHKTKEEVRNEYLNAMGNDLGQVYNALYNDVVWLHAKWAEFKKLYAHSKNRIEILNKSAGYFFQVINRVLLHDILLHIARLTDRPKSVGKDNLTLLRLQGKIGEPQLLTELTELIRKAQECSSFVREWRNRRLAHHDLALVLNPLENPLPDVNREKIEMALKAIRDVLNKLHMHYLNGEVAFEHVITRDDADSLIYRLRVAAHIEELRHKRRLQGKPLTEEYEILPEN